MKKNILLLFFIIIISNVYCNTLNDIIDKSIRFNKWEEARAKLEKYLSSNPTDTHGYSIYASVLNQLTLYDDAILAVRSAINYEKNNNKKSEFYFNLGTYYYNKGLKDIAMDSYNKSLKLNKKLDSPYYMIGLINYENKDFDNAISNWKSYIEYTDNAEKREKLREAITKFEKHVLDDKLKKEEEARQKEEFLKNLLEELAKNEDESKGKESDMNKEISTDDELEEIE